MFTYKHFKLESPLSEVNFGHAETFHLQGGQNSQTKIHWEKKTKSYLGI